MFLFLCVMWSLTFIVKADFWDRQDETCSIYSQMPLKLETVFSKVSSSLVKEKFLSAGLSNLKTDPKLDNISGLLKETEEMNHVKSLSNSFLHSSILF